MKTTLDNWHIGARVAIVASVTGAGILLVIAAFRGHFAVLSTHFMLTCFGLLAGAVIFEIGWNSRTRYKPVAVAGLIALPLSQIFYYLLIWSPLRADAITWRLWWLTMVPSVTLTHVLGLLPKSDRKPDRAEQITIGCAVASGLMLWGLGFVPEITLSPHPVFSWVFGPVAGGSIIGSIVVWRKQVGRRPEPKPMPKWARYTWATGFLVAAFMGGFYVGGAGQPAGIPQFPSALAGLSDEEIDAQVRRDFKRLKTAKADLNSLGDRAMHLKQELRSRRQKENRDYFLPEEEEQIRWHFVSYLSQRAVLLRLVGVYADFQSVREPEIQARCFTVGFAAAVLAYENALAFLAHFGDDDAVRRKLNEAEPTWNIKAGTYDKIAASVGYEDNIRMCDEMWAYYQFNHSAWKKAEVWEQDDIDWLDRRIRAGMKYVKENTPDRLQQWAERLLQRMKDDAYKPVYKAQSIISTWIGDVKVVPEKPLITSDQIKSQVQPRLQAGDILLERRNWYLSNAFLPGFWPHAALYVGTVDDLKRLGIADHPEIKSRLAAFARPADDGEPATVIESVSEGVIFNSLTHSMHADNVAVLRPRLTDKEIGQAIIRAFTHVGKPYDFEFDFFTSDKLVCTELVYRSYEGMLHFPLVEVMGRNTLPAIEIVRKFSGERGTKKQELDFVLFLDGVRKKKLAEFRDENEFCASVKRDATFQK